MPLILQVAIPAPLHRLFDYLPPPDVPAERLKPGIRLELPFGHSRKVGMLVGLADNPETLIDKLRPALAVLDETPLLSDRDLGLLAWASQYYHHPIGEVIATALATLLRKGASASPPVSRRLCQTTVAPTLPPGRAPRQAELLRRLRDQPSGLPAEALADAGLAATARALVRKGLATWRETTPEPFAPTASEMPHPSPALTLNAHQAAAVDAVRAALDGYRAFLLEGVTGSGKTEVYLRLTEAVLAHGRQVMILLPEINLTPQLEARFRARFAVPIARFHSALPDGERHRAWLSLQRGETAILLGTRSAVFTPARNLGLIVLDEEHDSAFKQQEGFRFSARDVAVKRASETRIPIVLGSATPSLESLLNAAQGRYAHLQLPYRAGDAAMARFQVLDIRAQPLQEGLSAGLMARMAKTLARGEQTLLFVNRRGFAPTLICHDCGWVAPCRHCDARLVIHARESRLRCHHCGYERPLPARCPDCAGSDLRPLGLGTERIEAALAERFPGARIARIDRDSTRRRGALEKMLQAIHNGDVDMLIGTQMLAKGHHFPGVTLVGILDVDAGLYSTDFRAGERTAQLILQVAGRAGRESRPGTVILQTRHPAHPLLLALVQEGYPAFARACLAERQAAGLPPYAYQALWRADARDSTLARQFLEAIAARAREQTGQVLQTLGPAPAPLARRGNRHRWQLLLQAEQRRTLHGLLDCLVAEAPGLASARGVRWSVDVDPIDLA
ncbi:primosomal protein N' [Methyloparacoccus murrellii]